MKKSITQKTVKTIGGVEKTVESVEKDVVAAMKPLQKTVLKRFPTFFALLVTFGVAITFLAFERIVADVNFIDERPWLMLSIGIGVLTITGTLYRKLG